VQKPKRRLPRFSNNRVIAPTHTALALKLVTGMDLLRLKSIARLYARGLPPEVAWDDLLQEAMTRMLTGSRLKPDDVPIVAFLAGVMRSLRADHLRRSRLGVKLDESWLAAKGSQDREALDPAADPERALIAVEELEKIRLLFADDPLARQIIDGLAEGLDAEQIRLRFDISRKDYDSARRRMRRCLLREGLTCRKT
jgi:DNA-directed RNA polymerase specialized sigma24 family protein